MCRNIRTLHNYEPPATEAEVRAAALQYVRKISGYTKPSVANREVFERAIEDVAAITLALVEHLVATGAPKDREAEKQKAKERWRMREERIAAKAR